MFKAVDKWFPGYLRSLLNRPAPFAGTRHLIFCVCDHFEPYRGGTDADAARQTVRDWLAAYPPSVESFRDADGRPPRHTFFTPQEEYDPVILDDLAAFCRQGFGEVEIHLHHRHDTAEGLREKLVTFRDLLHQKHGLLGCSVAELLRDRQKVSLPSTTQQPNNSTTSHTAAMPQYGFIHGNWSLCNSRPDGDWCGVNEELGILAGTGCYADFTFPSAPSPTQPRMVNALYYARDIPGRPRSADVGQLLSCQVAELPPSAHREEISCQVAELLRDGPKVTLTSTTAPLLLITGPLALNWRRRKWGILPRLENAEIAGGNPPTADRIRLWARQQIGVAGRPDWVFVKVHTHGCVPGNARVLLGESMRQAHEVLQREFNDGRNWQLHYVTAREMHNLVKAAEANLPGPPGQYRDTPIAWPV
jgi:hypothetical protein